MGSWPYLGALFLVLGAAAATVGLSSAAQAWVEDAIGSACAVASCAKEMRPTALILAGVFLPMGAMFTYVSLPSRQSLAKRRREKDLRATATILSLEDSGQRVQGLPFVRFQLQVEREGSPPQIVSAGSVLRGGLRIGPGDRVTVVIDPTNPNKVKIVWDA